MPRNAWTWWGWLLACALCLAGSSNVEGAEAHVKPVDARALQALLPEKLPGLRRLDATGQTATVLRSAFSQTRAIYWAGTPGDENAESLTIEITDMGQTAKALAAGWVPGLIDVTSDTGYEKTTTYQGHRAHEQFDRADRSGVLEVLVADRFRIAMRSTNATSLQHAKDALARIDLDKLAAMDNQEKSR